MKGAEVTIELWDWLEHLSVVVGTDFPEADEDALWRCSRAWAEAASELRALAPFAATAGGGVLAALGGEAGEAFARLWGPFHDDHGYFEQLADECDKLAEVCDRTASDVEYAKLEYIGALIVLAVTLASLAAAAVFGGLSSLGMPAAIAIAQFSVRLILTRLITSIIIGVGFVAGMDALAQAIQFFDGHRHEWDWSKTLRSVEDGAVYGAVGGVGFLGLGRLAPPTLGVRAGIAAMTGIGAGTGLVGGTLAPLAHGERPTVTDVGKATVASLIGGFASAHHGKGAAADLAGTEIADAHTVAAISDATLHLDGLPQTAAAGHHEAVPVGQHATDRSPADRTGPDETHLAPARQETPRLAATAVPADRLMGDRPDRALGPGAAATGRAPAEVGPPVPGHDVPAPDRRPAAPDQFSPTRVSATLGGHGSAGPVTDGSGPNVRLSSDGGQARVEAPSPSRPDGVMVTAVGIGRVEASGAWDQSIAASHLDQPPALARDVGHSPIWAGRGAQDPASPGWHDDAGSEAGSGVAYLLERARTAEPALTHIVKGVADRAGGELVGLTDRLKTADSTSEKLARYLRDHPSESVARGLAEITDTVRYTIVFPDESYARGAQAALDELAGSSLHPVRDRRSWDNSAGYLGVNSVWFDETTGHTFEVQLHTAASYAAKSVTHGMYKVIRTSVVELPELQAEHDAHFADVHVPDGALNVGIPDTLPRHPPTFEMPDDARSRSDPYPSHEPDLENPASGIGEPPDPRHPVTDAEAVALVRQHVVETDAGFAFYPVDDQMRDFARAMRPVDGLLTLDLHGSRGGFQVDHALLTPEQFALALRDLRDTGILDLPDGSGIKLLSCDTAFGGEHSPAARLARALGVEVVAPDEPVWTTVDGFEIVSSPILFFGNLLPMFPPDGAWHRFSPTGQEIPVEQDPSGRQWRDSGAGPAGHFIPRDRRSGLDPP